MKKRLSVCIAFSLMMSLTPQYIAGAETSEQVYTDLSAYFNDDLFLKTETKANNKYDLQKLYYDGSKYTDTVSLGNLTYKLYGDFDTRKNDVIKVNTNDVTVDMDPCAAKTLGIMIVAGESEKTVSVKVNYEGNISESYNIALSTMEEETDTNEGISPIMVVKSGIRYNPTVIDSEKVYLHDNVLDLSASVNKNLNVESVTFPKADFDYYVMAIMREKFSESEIEEQTQEAVRKLFGKYSALDFVELSEKKDGASISEAQELYSALLKQQGKMDEASKENIERIEKLISGCELYENAKNLKKDIEDNLGDYPNVSADFDDLSQTDLTDEDYQKLLKIVADYDEYNKIDLKKLSDITEFFGIADKVDVSVDKGDEEKIRTLLSAYEKAAKKNELIGKIDPIYNIYINKDISEITENDLKKLSELIGYFDEADSDGIVLGGYDEVYIKHLYNDYEKYQSSEEKQAIDVSRYYNVDAIASAGESASDDTWYESPDNISGEGIKAARHGYMSGYNSETGIMTLKEHEFVEKVTYDENTGITTTTYPFTATKTEIPFYIPEKGLVGGVCDAILLKKGSKETYTFDLGGGYTEKVYMLVTAVNTCNIEPVVTYTDGTSETFSVYANSTGQTVNAIRNSAKTYPDMVSCITSGDYKNYNRAKTGIIYAESGNTTNGFSVFAISTNENKSVKNIKFGATSNDYILLGLSQKPLGNDKLIKRAKDIYAEVVSDGEIVSKDTEKLSELSALLKDAQKRGLYIDGVDSDVTADIFAMVLSAEGSISRYDKDTVRAQIDFSVPVDKASVSGGISVMCDSKAIDGFTYDLSEDSKKLTIDIPADRYGNKVVSVAISGIKNNLYPEFSLVYPYELEYEVPEYLTIDFSNQNIMKITNNSQVMQEYLAYSTAKEGDKTVMVSTAAGTVAAGSTTEAYLSTMPGEGRDVYAGVLDKNTMKPLAETAFSEKTAEQTQKTANYKEPILDLEKNTVTIHGITPSQKEGKAVSAAIYDATERLMYIGEVLTNKDGYFALNVPIDESSMQISGYLTIKLGGDDFDELVEINDLYYPLESTRQEFVNKLKNAKDQSEVLELLKDAECELSINFAPFKEIMSDNAAAEKLAARIYKIRNELSEITASDSAASEKITKAQTIIKQQSVLACFEEKKTDTVSTNGELLYDDIMSYSSIDKNGVTLYALYGANISAAGKNAVVQEFSGKVYAAPEALLSDFAKAVMLNALKNPAQSGVGHVAKALTKENADLVGMNITKYLNLSDTSDADKAIANMNITKLSDVTDYINGLPDGSYSKPGGGKSSSSSSDKSSGVTIVPTAPEKDNTEKSRFDDVDESHWAYEAIEALAEKNIINGKSERTFAPNDTITRAEFVKLLCTFNGIETEENEQIFDDVDIDAWYAPYVFAAYKSGLVSGVSDKLFAPKNTISRQDICTLLYRADKSEYKGEADFADKEQIAPYAKDAIGYCYEKGIVKGFSDNTFRPAAGCTRAQAAAMIYNYMMN